MKNMNDKIIEKVREDYRDIALNKKDEELIVSLKNTSDEVSESIGYSKEEIESVPKEANLGLGCGNPFNIVDVKEGDIILDLGSGVGFDCFLAAKKVGKRGRVIGVDMTPEMLSKSRDIAKKNRFRNVEFRLGEIENLPVADNFVDKVISNCVINLSCNKRRVYDEIYRVLKIGGEIGISDIVIVKELTEDMKNNEDLYSC
ncbi:Methyltransferase domain-containing protein [Clostridium collagenovorans DSM 3089]|uniref:Arsenite methyltransferase n=1 Tax=Clostridium collagenovorans DSM 3089 TaxID=1121306 RepID=A0A1M5X698_9CLOT|nr:Methyltransferase domain-containing protein [Clostridium collagenovorans DSM 3089]